MNSLLSTALVMAGTFVVCYPIVILVINAIMTKIENDHNAANSVG